MDNLKLRTMTLKSTFTDGKYRGWTVKTVIDNVGTSFLDYLYFNHEKISFTDDVLDLLKHAKLKRITKPGIDKEYYKEATKSNYFGRSDEELKKSISGLMVNGKFAIAHSVANRRKKIRASKFAKGDPIYTKKSLQAKNHGR